ncbi:MAG TPA: hypothetical protein V6D19_03550 [Stenomitos sp.]
MTCFSTKEDFEKQTYQLLEQDDANYEISSYVASFELYDCKMVYLSHAGIEYHALLNLPKVTNGFKSKFLPSGLRVIGADSLLVDGIIVESADDSRSPLSLSMLLPHGIINFTGSFRPQLSVDRSAVSSWPDDTEHIMQEFFVKVVNNLTEHVISYLEVNSSTLEFNGMVLTLKVLMECFHHKATHSVAKVIIDTGDNLILPEISLQTSEKVSVANIKNKNSLKLKSLRFSRLEAAILMSFLAGSDNLYIIDDECVFTLGDSVDLTSLSQLNFYGSMTLRCDKWGGKYTEFDFVTHFYPVLPGHVFDKLLFLSKEDEIINNRCRISSNSNSLYSFSNLSPTAIHKEKGIHLSFGVDFWGQDIDRIYRFDYKEPEMFDLSPLNSGKEFTDSEKWHVFYLYVSPVSLNDKEIISLEELRTLDPDYTKGVEDGWSILMIGDDRDTTVIAPGIITRAEAVAQLPYQFWQQNKNKLFFLDDSSLKEYRS